MSRAHVRESDGDAPEDLPELPLSRHPNYVTPRGLALLQARLGALEADIAGLAPEAVDHCVQPGALGAGQICRSMCTRC